MYSLQVINKQLTFLLSYVLNVIWTLNSDMVSNTYDTVLGEKGEDSGGISEGELYKFVMYFIKTKY